MLRDENGFLAGYVYVDIAGREVGGYVDEAKKRVAEKLALPLGYVLQWSTIAAGALYPAFGILLSPMIAAAVMSFSSVSVIGHALRLRRTRT